MFNTMMWWYLHMHRYGWAYIWLQDVQILHAYGYDSLECWVKIIHHSCCGYTAHRLTLMAIQGVLIFIWRYFVVSLPTGWTWWGELTKRIARTGGQGKHPQNIERDIMRILELPLVTGMSWDAHFCSTLFSKIFLDWLRQGKVKLEFSLGCDRWI